MKHSNQTRSIVTDLSNKEFEFYKSSHNTHVQLIYDFKNVYKNVQYRDLVLGKEHKQFPATLRKSYKLFCSNQMEIGQYAQVHLEMMQDTTRLACLTAMQAEDTKLCGMIFKAITQLDYSTTLGEQADIIETLPPMHHSDELCGMQHAMYELLGGLVAYFF